MTAKVTSETNPDVDFRFAYTVRERDEETYYRARYFDPAPGTFVSTDPLGFGAGDSNFVFNSPTTFTDPSGKAVLAMISGALLLTGFSLLAQLIAPDGVQAPGIFEPLESNLDRSHQRAIIETLLSMGSSSVRPALSSAAAYGDDALRVAGSVADDLFRGLAGRSALVPIGPALSNVADDAVNGLIRGELGNNGIGRGVGIAAVDLVRPLLSKGGQDVPPMQANDSQLGKHTRDFGGNPANPADRA